MVADSEVYSTWDELATAESSSLAWANDTLLSVNDAGDAAVIYLSQGTSGQTTGTITYSDQDPVDVEAISATDQTIWVGDVGDNNEVRDSIALYRIPAPDDWSGDVAVTATKFEATYPDGAHNAEAILVDPASGEVLVVTKDEAGASVYSAGVPDSTDQPIALEPVATDDLLATVTDGSFSVDGSQVWLRNYDSVAVYSYPDWTLQAQAELPEQPKGEGLTSGPEDSWLISSETDAEVQQFWPDLDWAQTAD